MIVLGISETHCATAAILRDGEYAREYYGVQLTEPRSGLGRRARKLGARLGLIEPAQGKFILSEGQRLALVTGHLGLGADRIVSLDHHTCHAAAAYFGAPFTGADALVLTNDNSGDGLCATASSGGGTTLQRREATPSAPGSLGSFYSFVTLLLGMKFGEHEYKVMGLAPYAPARAVERARTALGEVFGLTEETPARFAWRRRGARYGGERLALGGGVFMNVKANMLLAGEEWVRELFVFPSCGDESNAIGAAYLGYMALARSQGVAAMPRPFGPAYLGPGI